MSKGMNKNTNIGTVKMIRGIGPGFYWNIKTNRQLIAGILELKSPDEAQRFLRDLMTPAEIKEFANRFEVAKLLSQSVQYATITEDTGLSSTTIARIAKWLYGSLGGYRLVLARLYPNIFSHHSNSFKPRKGLFLT